MSIKNMATFLQKSNNAKSTLSANITDSATSLTVADASSFPSSGDFHVTIWNKATYPDPSDDSGMEIVKVTAVASNTFTIVRAQESTTASAHTSGHAVELLFTVAMIKELEDAINDISDTDNQNASEVPFTPNGDIVSSDVQSAIVEVRDDIDTKLTGKANTSHTHVEADVTDLDKYTQAEVDSLLTAKSDTGHTHTESDITDLDKYTQSQVDTLLTGKSDTGHTHTTSDITDFLESLQDSVATLIQDGTGISWSYDDGAGTLTPTIDLSSFSISNLGTIDHDLLDGLSDDDHSQYALLAGRDGESLAIDQIKAYDSAGLLLTDDGNNGIFVKDGGDVAIDTDTLYMDATNNRVGIGTTSPQNKLDIAGGSVIGSTYAGVETAPTDGLLVEGQGGFGSSQSTAPLGSELTTNGEFTSDLTGWSGTNWAWEAGADGQARHTAGSTAALTQNITVTNGQTYHIDLDITGRTAGSVSLSVGGVFIYNNGTGTTFTSSTERTLVASGSGSQALNITPTSDFDGAVTAVSVKPITGTSTPQLVSYDDSGSVSLELRSDKGLNNTYIGINSGRYNTTGNNNAALGLSALYSNTTGNYNTAFGQEALYSNTTGNNNAAFGLFALRSNTTGYYNAAFGLSALYSNTTGNNNAAFGLFALRSNTTGNNNAAFGLFALYSNTTGNNNAALGLSALYSNTTGNNNAAFGLSAGRYQADGSTALTDPENSVYIGAGAKGYDNSDNNSIVIGYNATGLGANTVVLGNDSIVTTALKGNIGIGHTDPDTVLDINGALTIRELSADPSDPDEGSFAIWMSDGTGSGDDGDIMIKITAGATTKTTTLVDFSSL